LSGCPSAAIAIVPLLLALGRAPVQTKPAKPPTPEQEAEARRNHLLVLARDAKDQNDKRRLAAWEELLTFGDDGVKLLKPVVESKLERDRKSLEERFKGPELARARKKVEDALVARRKDATACIFDEARYPSADHGRVGQPEVDRLVKLVADVWLHPAGFTRTTIPEVDALASGLEEDVVYVETCGAKPPAELEVVATWLDRFNAVFELDKLGISEQQHTWNVEVAKYHAEELLTSADAEELACMNATNAYRLQMGVPLLEMDERLVRAARKHSQEMKELGYFEHSSPRPENGNPGIRCSHEGYRGYGGENIAGAGDGVGAFDGWYHSSGHHRNMLGGHRQFGVGRGGDYPGELFTQDFGNGDTLRGRKIEDAQILYLGKVKKLDPKSAESEYELAKWCRAEKLDDLAKQHAQRALELDPKHAKARELLDDLAAHPSRDEPEKKKSAG
jgi:hypothetical protein